MQKNLQAEGKGQGTTFLHEVIFELNYVQRKETRTINICGRSKAKQIQAIPNVSGKKVP